MAAQELTAQEPVEHDIVAFGPEQATPQPPQLAKDARLTSQPSPAEPLQLARSGSHELTAHEPPEQMGVAKGSEHALPQDPQLLIVLRLVSHPSA